MTNDKADPGLHWTESTSGGPILHSTLGTTTPTPLHKGIFRGRTISKRLRRNPSPLVARQTQMRPTSKQWPHQIYVCRMPAQIHRGYTTTPPGSNLTDISSSNRGRTATGHRLSAKGILGIHPHHDNQSIPGTPQTLGVRPRH